MANGSRFIGFYFLRFWWLGAVAVLTWSSWYPPSLHDYAPQREFVTLAAPGLQPGSASAQLQARALALPGVAACAVRPAAQLLTLAYDPARQTPALLCQRLSLRQLPAAPASASARQCPVPAGYVLALEHVRFSLNLRRLFVRL